MPLVNRTFSQLIDFTRTTSATYVNSAGLIATTPASVNLLTYTQEFDTAAWLKALATATANAATAPDGTSTADKIVGTATAGYHSAYRFATETTSPYTYSVYVLAAEYTKCTLTDTNNGRWSATFDLAAGTVLATTGASALSAAITSVGSGWYRCAITYTGTAGVQTHGVIGYPTGASITAYGASYTGDGTSGIYVWGAQLEQASSASTYTRNYGGVYPPRFDYDPVTLAPKGFLIEEQRTNLLTYSEQFDNAAWTKLRATISANSTPAPDGTTSADTLVDTAVAGTHVAIQAITKAASAIAYAASVYVKQSGLSKGELRMSDQSGNGLRAAFDLAAGTVGALASFGTGFTLGTSSIAPAGNGWYRVTITGTSNTATSLGHEVYLADASGNTSYTGTGTGFFVWGAQLEAGAFATSYIPTVASQVTRTADVAAIAAPNFASWYNQTEGTLLVEGSVYSTGLSGNRKTLAVITEGNFNNVSRTGVESGTSAGASVISGGATQAAFTVTSAVSVNTPFKMALAVKTNDFAFCANGGAVSTDTSGSVVAAPIVLDLGFGPQNSSGSTNTAGDYLNGHIRSMRYYPTRLTNAQLQALTA